METDRDLVEQAAKAAGCADLGMWDESLRCLWDGEGWSFDPLRDDGDAFRLAVKLNLLVLPYPKDNAVRVTRLDLREAIVSFGTPPDPCDATRRAIVRAAAEIGRATP